MSNPVIVLLEMVALNSIATNAVLRDTFTFTERSDTGLPTTLPRRPSLVQRAARVNRAGHKRADALRIVCFAVG